ncbi:hypothetical protein [Formosa sp. PL04]|uniref:hypothetical protein n=1 Tax=Formosa sp. PL04 TaxID=3081755 RepID=UPI002982A12A|nr:hypothetical protein [Formosa sp. PL04]MDW5288926.1 hypothetical protein [Formosa sp. PL04]
MKTKGTPMSTCFKKISQFLFILLVFGFFGIQNTYAQYPNTKVRDINQAYVDSLKQIDYDHTFPIWGEKAYKMGVDIPYPVGAMVNYIWMEQGLLINNLQLGLQTDNIDLPLTDASFITTADNVNTTYTINFRPDLWVFPFLNVYGIIGYSNVKTEVNLTYPIKFTSVVDQSASTAGVGVLTAFGIGTFYLATDFNFTWTKPELVDKAVPVSVFGARFGKSFVFKNKPTRNLSFWAGAMYINTSGGSTGSITFDELLPNSDDKRNEIVTNYNDWYANEATPAEKKAADKILTPIVDHIENASGDGTILYSLNKGLAESWSGVVGMQFQYNKHLMLRTETSILADRRSFLLSFNYRFLL